MRRRRNSYIKKCKRIRTKHGAFDDWVQRKNCIDKFNASRLALACGKSHDYGKKPKRPTKNCTSTNKRDKENWLKNCNKYIKDSCFVSCIKSYNKSPLARRCGTVKPERNTVCTKSLLFKRDQAVAICHARVRNLDKYNKNKKLRECYKKWNTTNKIAKLCSPIPLPEKLHKPKCTNKEWARHREAMKRCWNVGAGKPGWKRRNKQIKCFKNFNSRNPLRKCKKAQIPPKITKPKKPSSCKENMPGDYNKLQSECQVYYAKSDMQHFKKYSRCFN